MTETQERKMNTKLKEHYYCSKCGMPFDTHKNGCEVHERNCNGIKLEYQSNRNTIYLYYLGDNKNNRDDFTIEKHENTHDSQYNASSYAYSIYLHRIKDLEIALRRLLIYVIGEMCEFAKRELNVSFDYTPIKLLDFKMNDE